MDPSRFRAVAGLVAAAVVLGVFTLSPVSAHFTQNTKHLGKHAWQQFIKKRVTKSFVQEGKILSATVTGAGTENAEIVRGRGAVQAEGDVATDVEFTRKVHNCTWTATYGEANLGVMAMVHPTGGNPKGLRVWLADDEGGPIVGNQRTFHLIVVCP
ncbi:MAG TPA: hypothetical protein VF058_03420 [Actinomycetota bacterium]